MNPEAEVTRLLEEHGALLMRSKKHKVYRLPNGQAFVQSKTPSDINGPLNELSDLRKALGISDPDRGKPGIRRERKVKSESQPRTAKSKPTVNGALQEKLLISGLAFDALQKKTDELQQKADELQGKTDELQKRTDELILQVDALEHIVSGDCEQVMDLQKRLAVAQTELRRCSKANCRKRNYIKRTAREYGRCWWCKLKRALRMWFKGRPTEITMMGTEVRWPKPVAPKPIAPKPISPDTSQQTSQEPTK